MKRVRKILGYSLLLYMIFFLLFKSYPSGFWITGISFLLGLSGFLPVWKYEKFYVKNPNQVAFISLTIFLTSVLFSFFLINGYLANTIFVVIVWSFYIFLSLRLINPNSEDLIKEYKIQEYLRMKEEEIIKEKANKFDQHFNSDSLHSKDTQSPETYNSDSKNTYQDKLIKPIETKTELNFEPPRHYHLFIKDGNVILAREKNTLQTIVYKYPNNEAIDCDLEESLNDRSRFLVTTKNGEVILCQLKSTHKKKVLTSNIFGKTYKARFSSGESFIFQTENGNYKGYFNSTRKDKIT